MNILSFLIKEYNFELKNTLKNIKIETQDIS